MDDSFRSRKSDSTPMIDSGIKQIGAWQIDQYFLDPFQGGVVDTSRRLYLVRKLTAYLSELKKYGIHIEVWVDGSFVTNKPDPEDIDMVVWSGCISRKLTLCQPFGKVFLRS